MTPVYFWFRRDLRLEDNHGLFQALSSGKPCIPVFIFDTRILSELPKDDARVSFIHRQLAAMKKRLQEMGTDLIVAYDTPEAAWNTMLQKHGIGDVFCNEDYEPYAAERDSSINKLLAQHGAQLHAFKDQVVKRYDENLKSDGSPYTVFTPYHKNWLHHFQLSDINPYPSENLMGHFKPMDSEPMIRLSEMGFTQSTLSIPEADLSKAKLNNYGNTRDIPSISGTSRASIHLRFGTISIRHAYKVALDHSDKWLAELNWREFYMQILAHFPRIVHESFRPIYDRIEWRNNAQEIEAWKQGKTGYPMVDAGMRELNATGFMHNRVRMVVASFLTKHLLVDWRIGEAYFAEKLLDFELASNNGGWQWAAGSGVDAAPYFRVFNPTLQAQKFDPKALYIKKWVPEFGSFSYQQPIVNHEFARKRCLEVYTKALK